MYWSCSRYVHTKLVDPGVGYGLMVSVVVQNRLLAEEGFETLLLVRTVRVLCFAYSDFVT